MQSVSSRIWTRVAVFISNDDNHYTTGTSKLLIIVCWSIGQSTSSNYSCCYNSFFLVSSSHQLTLLVFYWNLSDNKSLHIFRTLLSIRTDLNNPLLSILSLRPSISNSSSPLSKAFGETFPSEPITIAITVTLNFLIYLRFLLFSLCGPLG